MMKNFLTKLLLDPNVMPDLIRHPGILRLVVQHWIPGRARNDEKEVFSDHGCLRLSLVPDPRNNRVTEPTLIPDQIIFRNKIALTFD